MPQRNRAEISASEVRTRISEVISRVAFGGERLIVTRHQNVRVAIVPLTDLDRLRELDRAEAVRAVAKMRKAAARSGAGSMTEDEVDAEIAAARRERRDSIRRSDAVPRRRSANPK